MQKTLRLLSLLLGAQLLLALGLSQSGPVLGTADDGAPLLQVAPERVKRITLEGPDDARVTLVHTADGWQLPDADNFPADAQRVTQLLERLTTLRPSLPVASTRGARERFKVSDDHFERRITLADSSDKLATLYLGSSPGRNRVHARRADRNEIATLRMAAYEIPVGVSDWEDKKVLQLPEAQISAIRIGDLELERAQTGWTAVGLQDGERLDSEAADRLAGLLAGLRFDTVLGQAQKPDYGLEEPALALTLTRREGEPVTYQLGKQPDNGGYTLKVSSRPEYFSVPAYTAEPLIEAASRQEKLIRPAATAGPGEQPHDDRAEGAS